MRDFVEHSRYPIPTTSCSGLAMRIRKAIIEVDGASDPQEREKGIANAVIAASNVWLENDCFCSQCWDEYREAVRLLVS